MTDRIEHEDANANKATEELDKEKQAQDDTHDTAKKTRAKSKDELPPNVINVTVDNTLTPDDPKKMPGRVHEPDVFVVQVRPK